MPEREIRPDFPSRRDQPLTSSDSALSSRCPGPQDGLREDPIYFSGVAFPTGRRFSSPEAVQPNFTRRRAYCLAPWAQSASRPPLNASPGENSTRLHHQQQPLNAISIHATPSPLSQSFPDMGNPNDKDPIPAQPPHTPLAPAFGEDDAALPQLTDAIQRSIEVRLEEQRQKARLVRRHGASPPRVEDFFATSNGAATCSNTPGSSRTPRARQRSLHCPFPGRSEEGVGSGPAIDAPNWDHFAAQFRQFTRPGEGRDDPFSTHQPSTPLPWRTRHLSLIPVPTGQDVGRAALSVASHKDPQPWAAPTSKFGPTNPEPLRGQWRGEDYDSRAFYHYASYLAPSQQQNGSKVDRGSLDDEEPSVSSPMPPRPYPPPPVQTPARGSQHQEGEEVSNDDSSEGDDFDDFDNGVFGSHHVAMNGAAIAGADEAHSGRARRREVLGIRDEAQLQVDRSSREFVVGGGEELEAKFNPLPLSAMMVPQNAWSEDDEL